MKKIQNYVNQIDEELESAKEYAETYLEYKSVGNSAFANRYKEMASDELKHASNIHEVALSDIEELKKVYTPPVEMQEEWERKHREYVERTSFVKMMLQM